MNGTGMISLLDDPELGWGGRGLVRSRCTASRRNRLLTDVGRRASSRDLDAHSHTDVHAAFRVSVTVDGVDSETELFCPQY
jgi:hypothetical protein